ncbi:MAG: hypothetical protein GX557_14485, partial [Chloroflexi bacterium]|nr:hypothetical protein [Chloroflexota bacterium]
IPVYLNICHEMEKRCPQAILINHSNPMAVLCRAMTKYSSIQVIGLCHGVQIGIVYLAEVLGVPPEELDTLWIGTNHYHWFTRIRHRGRDVYPEARARLAALTGEMRQPMTQALSRLYGHAIVYPYDDHAIEFYPYMTQLAGRVLPYGLDSELVKWLGEQGYDRDDATRPAPSPEEAHAARQAQLADYAAKLAALDLPAGPTTSLQGEPLGRLIEALASGRREVYIVNIPNRGAVPNLADEAVLEIEAVTDSCGVRGVFMGAAPLALQGLLAKRTVWQELVADAGAKGDRQAALQALLTDEMAILPDRCEAMLDELLAASKPLLPQFA